MNGWEKDEVSGLELLVDDYDKLDQIAEDLYFNLVERNITVMGIPIFTRSIKEMNPMIFNWLDVLDVNVVVILILIFAVAGFYYDFRFAYYYSGADEYDRYPERWVRTMSVSARYFFIFLSS